MKNTISLGQPTGIVRRMKWQYVSLAAGLGLAAAAAVGLGGRAASPAQPVAPVRTAIASFPASQERPTVVFYLVKSPEAATLAEAYEDMARWIRVEGNVPEPKRSVVILDASTEAAASNAKRVIDDAMAASNFVGYEAPQFVVSELR